MKSCAVKKIEIKINEEKTLTFDLIDDSKPAPPPTVSLKGVFRIHDLDSEIDDKHVLDFFWQRGVLLADDERMVREHYSNRFLGGQDILNGVRRFAGTWLLPQTQRAVDCIGIHELLIDGERHQMRVEMVGGPRRCYVCGNFGHVAAAHNHSGGSATSWAGRASRHAGQHEDDDHEDGEIDDEQNEEVAEADFTQQAAQLPLVSLSALNPNLSAANFPALQELHVDRNNVTNPFVVPTNPAPPTNQDAHNAGLPFNSRLSRQPNSKQGGGRQSGVTQSGSTTPQNSSGSRRSSRKSTASRSASRDSSASEAKSNSNQSEATKRRINKSIANLLVDANRNGLASTDSSPTDSAAKKPAFVNGERENDGMMQI